MRIEGALRPIDDLFRAGALGSRSDEDLLGRFVAGHEEAAFAALVQRHGPMVRRVCRNTLGDPHEAEDAFQATFLVLALRAGSICGQRPLAPWLYGVARRVALKARGAAIRRRNREQSLVDAPREPAAVPPEPLPEVLEELDRLPDRLRAVVVLCDLEGHSYASAADRLGCPEATVHSRLFRARKRLRDRLSRRGLAPTAVSGAFGGLTAGRASAASAPKSEALAKLAALVAAGGSASAGAVPATIVGMIRGALRAMLLSKLKTVGGSALILGLAGLGGVLAWRATATAGDDPAPVVRAAARQEAPGPPEAGDDDPSYRMEGNVRVEGTGEPVEGARLMILLGDSGAGHRAAREEATSGPGGRFSVGLPPGNAWAFTLSPPPGYWLPNEVEQNEMFVVSEDEPVFRKDYEVRPGTIWTFRLVTSPDATPAAEGVVGAYREGFSSHAKADASGITLLTLPTEAGALTANVAAAMRSGSPVAVPLRWDAGFRPSAVARSERAGDEYRLTDEDGRTAAVGATEGLDPIVEDGRLTLRVTLPGADPEEFGSLAGRVIDAEGRPIEGARVALGFSTPGPGGGSSVSWDEQDVKTTDAEGRFAIPSIPRKTSEDVPHVFVVALKDGYAGVDTPPVPFEPGEDGTQEIGAPILLEPGVTLSGSVVDPEGRPVEGAWIQPTDSYATRARFTKTDEEGRFTVDDLSPGAVFLSVTYGDLFGGGRFVAAEGREAITITLRPQPSPEEAEAAAEVARAAIPEAVPVGQPAPELTVGEWSDGQARSLDDYQGKVVFLEFWGIWCGPCLHAMPVIDKLRETYEPRGVVFLSIHTPGEGQDAIRRLIEQEGVTKVFALDARRDAEDSNLNGETAQRYGVRGYPTDLLIDREGNIAFRSDDPANMPKFQALVEEMGLDPSGEDVTEEQVARLMERALEREIEAVLGQSPSP